MNVLLSTTEELFKKCLSVMRAKNADYSGVDCFENFRASATLTGVPMTKGVMVRLADKFTRIKNLLDKSNVVKDEAIQDTILDAINYLAILYSILENLKDETAFDQFAEQVSNEHSSTTNEA